MRISVHSNIKSTPPTARLMECGWRCRIFGTRVYERNCIGCHYFVKLCIHNGMEHVVCHMVPVSATHA